MFVRFFILKGNLQNEIEKSFYRGFSNVLLLKQTTQKLFFIKDK